MKVVRKLKPETSWPALRRRMLVESSTQLAQQWAADKQIKLLIVDCEGVRTAEAVMDRCRGVLEFPDWAGPNWDAFNDLIHDLSWFPDDRLVVLFKSVARKSRVARELRFLCRLPLDQFYFTKPKIVFMINYEEKQ